MIILQNSELDKKLKALEKEFKQYLVYQDSNDVIRASLFGNGNELVSSAPENAKKAYKEYTQLINEVSCRNK